MICMGSVKIDHDTADQHVLLGRTHSILCLTRTASLQHLPPHPLPSALETPVPPRRIRARVGVHSIDRRERNTLL